MNFFNQFELILATDLDGTFLDGDHHLKNYFYQELLRLREKVLLIYVTGRPIHIVHEFCKKAYLPYPHFVMGDHGTHIVDENFAVVHDLQNSIIEKWNNSNDFLKELLREDIGIQLQPIDPPYRVAYYYDKATLQTSTLEKITNAGFDVVLSCDMYLDILPKGINKGSSLLNILNYLQLNPDLVITAGDSLNDLSLFQTGLKSIVVGNSEFKLIETTKKLENVYQSLFAGVAGMIDGLFFYNKMDLFDRAPLSELLKKTG